MQTSLHTFLPGLEELPNELASTQSISSAQAGVSPPDPGSSAPDTGLNTRQPPTDIYKCVWHMSKRFQEEETK